MNKLSKIKISFRILNELDRNFAKHKLNLSNRKHYSTNVINSKCSDAKNQQTIYEINKINNFQKLSNILNNYISELNHMNWLERPCESKKIIDHIELILRYNEHNPLSISLSNKIRKNNDLNSLNKYFLENLSNLNPKEQAILFRLLILIDRNNIFNPIISKLENNLYEQLNRLDLNDISNYQKGLYLLKKSIFKMEPLDQIAKILNEKIMNIIESNDSNHDLNLNSIEKIFPNISLSSPNLFSVLSVLRFYFPFLTTESQNRYFDCLVEKANKMTNLDDNLSDLADLLTFLDTNFKKNIKINNSIFASFSKYQALIEKSKSIISSNVNKLVDDYERFQGIANFFLSTSYPINLSVKSQSETLKLLDNFYHGLKLSNDSQNIIKNLAAIRVFAQTVGKDFSSDNLVKNKCKTVIDNMEIYSIKRLLTSMNVQISSHELNNCDLLKESLKNFSNSDRDDLLYFVTKKFPEFFSENIADSMKSSKFYPMYVILDTVYFNSNFNKVLEVYQQNVKFYLYEHSFLIDFIDKLKIMKREKLVQNSEILIQILNDSLNTLIKTLSFDSAEENVKPIQLPNDPNEKFDFNQSFNGYKSVKQCRKQKEFIYKFYNLLEKNSINDGYLDLSVLNLEKFKLSCENFKKVFYYVKTNRITDENLREYFQFNLAKLVGYYNVLCSLAKSSQFYSPILNRDLIKIFLSLCEILCDSEYEIINDSKTNLLTLYDLLFRSIELYEVYDINCEMANISEQEKKQLNFYLTKIYHTLNPRKYALDIISDNSKLSNVNVFVKEAVENLEKAIEYDLFDNPKDQYNSKFVYHLIKLKFPQYISNLDIDFRDKYYKSQDFHKTFLKLYANYLNKNPKLAYNIRTNYSFTLDQNGKFLKYPENSLQTTLNIPVKILDKGTYFKNTNKIKRKVFNHIEVLQTKYPVLILYQNELERKTEDEVKQLVEQRLLESIKKFYKK
ncbi:unnamed protein product [Brachionus calyciflorus]|uniref:Uncharacterized protein n=1 Tax=Brachionus calyciflorus TaxID=104777 RepID=A0A813RMN9_9BILA|nr:unnamed protein product [Brachionus calyciflorus]